MMDGQGWRRRAGCAMSLHIENEETCRLAGDLAEPAGAASSRRMSVANALEACMIAEGRSAAVGAAETRAEP